MPVVFWSKPSSRWQINATLPLALSIGVLTDSYEYYSMVPFGSYIIYT